MGDFYETFDADAELAARVLGIALTSRPMGKGEGRIPLAGVPHHQLERYLDILVNAGHRVAIAEQTSLPPSKGGTQGLVERRVTRVVTPGTVDSGALITSGSNNWLSSIVRDPVAGPNNWGIATVDVTTGEIRLKELNQGEILGELSRLNPREILCEQIDTLHSLNTSELPPSLRTIRPPEEFQVEYARIIWSQTSGHPPIDSFGLEDHTQALRALGAILGYIQEVWPDALAVLRPPRLEANNDFIFIDPQTRRSLDLINTRERSEESLLSVIDQTRTPMGKRLLEDRISRPSRDLREIADRLDEATLLLKDHHVRDTVRVKLSKLSDIDRLVARISSGSRNGKLLAQLRDTLRELPAIADLISPNNTQLAHLLRAGEELLILTNQLETVLAEDPPVEPGDQPTIQEEFSNSLDHQRVILTECFSELTELEVKERESTGLSIKVGYNRVFGYFLECPRSQAAHVPETYEAKQTLANSQRFTLPLLDKIENSIKSAQAAIIHEEETIVHTMFQAVIDTADKLRELALTIARLDVACSSAELAHTNQYVRPKIVTDSTLEIINGRHPVVESKLQTGEFIANDCKLGSSAPRIMLLTGPNMAGKSTYLRQCALIVLLAHAGFYVPAEQASVPLVDRIYSRVGAQDQIAAGRSTFMVEMSETATILNNMSNKSLIIFDEVGRGTATEDGLAIAQAILEHLHNDISPAPLTLFATHYRELTDVASQFDDASNHSVSVVNHDGNIVFLHKIVEGAADGSYGVHVASLAGLPESVVLRAKTILASLSKLEVQEITSQGSASEATDDPRGLDREVIKQLENLTIDQMSPKDALDYLYELKARINDFKL